jgi:YD repeat-containing protein
MPLLAMSGKTLAWTTLVLAAFAAISPADASPDLPTNYCRANLRTRTLDALHRELKVVDAEGGAVETRFDAVNRRWLSDPRKYETWLSYDAVNRPTGQEDHAPGGSLLYTQTTTYRDALRKEEHVSRAGLSTLTTRDGLGRGVRVERSGTGDDGVKLSAADLSEFDAAGNVTLKTDGNGHATRSEFDGLGRKVAETLADGTAVAARTTSTYDKAGNRLEVKGPRGTWAYDLHQDYDDPTARCARWTPPAR